MKNFLKEYFTFTRSEKNGIIVLLSIIVVLLIVWKFLFLFHHNKTTDFTSFEKKITEFENSLKKVDSLDLKSKKTDSLNLFIFNPNTASDSNWVSLGLKAFQIKTIRNYLSKGGKFKTKEDFKKMWCIKPELFEKLEPYISIAENHDTLKQFKRFEKKHEENTPQLKEFDPNCTSAEEWASFGLTEKQIKVLENFTSKGGKFKTKEDFKKMYCILPQQYDLMEPYINIVVEVKPLKFDPNIKIDINTADSIDFRKLKGISPFMAGKIVKYRYSLGGFISKKQLLEIWGMKSDIYNGIEPNLVISTIQIKKINLNKAEFADLAKHPYLNYATTKAILNYRKIINTIKTLNELVSNKIIADTTLNKLKPYIVAN